ncbi:translesion DNA synthesis-associated protein ImuA [Paraburkholderia sp. DD10]|jgi:protein ImuA|uniref:Protein ImuA n=1 Tax=Paraburkholderia terricola TaxID=169427 RepID=A0A1M6VWZ1_9BURK|nr:MULTISPECIES: translesion DNA synthesis-associated protein ImuA [Paraburkholderia]MDR6446518.1 protein ImuA [Paraburkholderia terricola]SDP12319.1 protein ImuA [Paraburkholderia sediminicola]SHK86032.1 protein ImuA [Paraburkholderia terricola]
MTTALPVPEAIHPSLWRASQLARSRGHIVDTGYPALSAELPGGGWPVGALVDLLVQQAGVGEMRLLRPALSEMEKRPIAMVQPPHVPNGLGLEYIGLSSEQLMVVQAPKTADALWAAEQILRAGSCGALLFWAQHVQTSSLRRLHLAAQSSETLFFMIRPLASAQDASPAVLRLALRPERDGLTVDITKRRGPARAEPLSIPLQPTPVLFSHHARISRRSPAPVAARGLPAEVAA